MMQNKVVSLVLNNFMNDSRVLKQATTISEMGYRVSVIALHEVGLQEYEFSPGFNVHRVKLKTKSWRKTKLLQVVKYIEFMVRVIYGYRNANIVHCHDLTALPIGCLIKWMSLGKIKLIYDSHEYAINDLPYESKLRQKFKQILEGIFIKSADAVITVSDGIADLYQKIHRLKRRPSVVLNCPVAKKPHDSNVLKERLNLSSDTYLFLYQGALSRGRGIQNIIDGFKASQVPRIAVVFMGYGELTEIIKKQVDSRVFYIPAVSPEELLDYTVSANCGIALIEDSCLSYRHCLPNKLFEYFMAGLPVIVSNLPEMKNVVTKYKVGHVCQSNNINDIEKAINTALNMDLDLLGSNLEKVTQRFNWDNQANIIKTVYDNL